MTTAVQQLCLFKSIFELPGKLSRGKLQRLFSNFASSNPSLNFLANSREADSNGCSATLLLQMHLSTSWPTLERQITTAIQKLCFFKCIFQLPGQHSRGKIQRLFTNHASANASLNFLANSREANYNDCSATLPLQTHLWTSWSTLERQVTTAVQELCLFKRIFELPGQLEKQITTAVQQLCLFKRMFEPPGQLSRGILQRLFSNSASSNASSNLLSTLKRQETTAVQQLCLFSSASSNFLANSREANYNGCLATLIFWSAWLNFLANSREANYNCRSATLPLQTHLWTSWPNLKRQIPMAVQQLCLIKRILELPGQPSRGNFQRLFSNLASSNASLNFPANKFQRLFTNFSSSNASFHFLANSREANYNDCSPTFPLQTQFWTSWPTLKKQITTAVHQPCLCKRSFELPGQRWRGKLHRLFCIYPSSKARLNFTAISLDENFKSCSQILPLQTHLRTSWPTLERQISKAVQQLWLVKRIFELPDQLSRGKFQWLFSNVASSNASSDFLANSREANFNGYSATSPL